MARDYKSRVQARHKRPGAPCWVWLIVGVVVGAFAVALVSVKLVTESPDGPAPSSQAQSADKSQVARETAPKPRFDFYNILPEMEVVVPEEEIRASGTQPPTITADGQSSETYLLQVGSFRKPGDADRLRAQLALLGVEADIQKVSINNRDTWHRVRAGPYKGTRQVQEARTRLQRNGFESIVVRLKQ